MFKLTLSLNMLLMALAASSVPGGSPVAEPRDRGPRAQLVSQPSIELRSGGLCDGDPFASLRVRG
ncbi:hypothetical protein [Sphingomicrobium nitratireducens]|uniref:hypothetical protein n=1 Tax=Sphingomicrobium nitratireducens TaxID=2964666 RepID=UPI00223ED9AE|nr:hypothetical protein [Sphingomicrobium nitratireducens]